MSNATEREPAVRAVQALAKRYSLDPSAVAPGDVLRLIRQFPPESPFLRGGVYDLSKSFRSREEPLGEGDPTRVPVAPRNPVPVTASEAAVIRACREWTTPEQVLFRLHPEFLSLEWTAKTMGFLYDLGLLERDEEAYRAIVYPRPKKPVPRAVPAESPVQFGEFVDVQLHGKVA